MMMLGYIQSLRPIKVIEFTCNTFTNAYYALMLQKTDC